MKFILSFAILALMAFSPMASQAALSNENNPQVAIVDLGSITATADVYGAFFPKKSKIVSVKLVNGANITSSDTDKAVTNLQLGSTVLAEHKSAITGNTSAIAANVPAAMNLLVSEVAAGSWLKVSYTESGTYAMTNAKVIITYYPL